MIEPEPIHGCAGNARPHCRVDGKLFKEYCGTVSDINEGEFKHVEGKRFFEPVIGRLADTRDARGSAERRWTIPIGPGSTRQPYFVRM